MKVTMERLWEMRGTDIASGAGGVDEEGFGDERIGAKKAGIGMKVLVRNFKSESPACLLDRAMLWLTRNVHLFDRHMSRHERRHAAGFS